MYDVRITLAWPRVGPAPLEELVAALPAGGGAGQPAPDRLIITSVQHDDNYAPNVVGYALAAARGACAWCKIPNDLPVLAIDVCTPEEAERRGDGPPPLDLVSTAEAAEMLGVTAAAVRARAADPRGFAGGVRVGDAGWVFPRAEVAAMAGQVRSAHSPATAEAPTPAEATAWVLRWLSKTAGASHGYDPTDGTWPRWVLERDGERRTDLYYGAHQLHEVARRAEEVAGVDYTPPMALTWRAERDPLGGQAWRLHLR